MTELYHYTCEHAAPKIGAAAQLRGATHDILLGHGRLLWLTDLDVPVARALGLSRRPECDRTRFRVAVDGNAPNVARWLPWARKHVLLPQRQAFELNDRGALLAHWWVGFGDLPILRIDDMQQPLEGKPL